MTEMTRSFISSDAGGVMRRCIADGILFCSILA